MLEENAAEKEAEQVARLMAQVFASAAPVPPPDEIGPSPARLAPPLRPRIQPTSRPDPSLGSGSPLPEPIRRRLEPVLGLDLSSVRVHTDAAAQRLAGRHQARAFTYGSHLVFGRGEYAPDRAEGWGVLSHELVHVVQQSPVGRDPWSQGSLSTQARPRGPPRRPSSPVSVVQHIAVPRVQRLPSWDDVSNTFVAVGSAAVDTAVDVGSSAVGVAVDIGEGALEVGAEVIERTADFFIGLIDDYAPGLLEFLRGGFMSRLTDLFCRGLDAVIGSLISSLEDIDFVSALEEAFASAQGSVEGVIGAIRSGASSALGSLMQPVVEALDEYGPGIIDAITGASDSVNGFFDSIWESIGAPALDFLGEAGGEIWQEITDLIDWLWDSTAGIREAAADAWDWVMEQFDIAWESTSGIRDWLAEKATEAWDAMKEALGPLEGPITVLLAILLILSPLGPIIIATQVIPPLWEKLVWLWNNWNTDDILVWAQDTLREDILPGVINLVSGVASAIAHAASWIAGVTVQVAEAFGGVIGAFGGNSCLATVTRVLNAVSSQFERLAAWAEGGFTGLADAIENVFNSIVAILQPILDFLIRLFLVVTNPPLLPIAIAGAIWLLIPDELKPPVINFVLDLIIAFLRGFPAFLTGLGPLASILKAGCLGFLEGLRGAEDQLKIDASNKVANLMAGAGLEFIAGFAVGILEGLIDGILDPFRLIWMLIQFLARLCRSIGDYLAPLLFEAAPEVGAAVTSFNASVRATIPDHPPAHAPPESGEGTTGTLTRVSTTPDEGGAAATGETGTLTRATPGSAVGPTALAPPTSEASASTGSSAASPEDAVAAELMAAGPTASDADIVASLSPGLAGELTGAAGELDAAGSEGETSAESEASSEGSSVGGLAALLGGVWTAILEGAHGLGGRAAGALLEFILLPDYELGNKIGYVVGLVLLEVIIAYFSGGVSVELKAAEPFIKAAIRFLDLGGEILGLLGRAIRPIKGPLLRGFSAVGEHLGRFRFLQPLIQRIRRAADTLFHFGDEAAEAAGRAGGRADDVARHADDVAEGVGRRADDVAEGAGRRADDVAGTGRRADDVADASRRADDVPRVGDDAARTGGPTRPHGDDAARAARKAAEMPAALAAAQAICEANDRIDTPTPVVWAELMGLRARFTWIDTFRIMPKASPGHFEIHLIASDTTVDRDYTFFRIGPDEMDELITFWRQRVNRMSGPRRAEAERYLRRLREARRRGTPPRTRPPWWATEAEAAHFYDEAGDVLGTMANRRRHTRDVPYIHGRDANFIRRSDGSYVPDRRGRPMYERGHTRPDIIHGSHAIEVKNYRLTEPGDVDRLARTLEDQVGDRASLHVGPGRGRGGLPAHIDHQALILDVRGQRLTDAELRDIGDRLIERINRRLDDLVAGGEHAVGRQRFTRADIQFIVDAPLRRSASGDAPSRVPAAVRAATRQAGRPLPPALRHRAEGFFHADLGHVRVHTDDLAGRAVAESRAHALTDGAHILLGRGRRDFSQPETLATLAHEITHTLQPGPCSAASSGFEPDNSPAEIEARRAAAAFTRPGAHYRRPAASQGRSSAGTPTPAGPFRRETDEDDTDARRREAVSAATAWLSAYPPIVMDDNAPVLIAWARKKVEIFDSPDTTDEHRMYIAQGLLKVHESLTTFASRAARDADGALLYTSMLRETKTPWTEERDKELATIAPFTALDLVRWQTSAKPLPAAVPRSRRRRKPPEKPKKAAAPDRPPPVTGTNITFPKQKDMSVKTEEGQRLMMAFVIASTRRGISGDQISWLASQLSTENRWRPPDGVDLATWQDQFEAIPVGDPVTLTITKSFDFEVDYLMNGMPRDRDFLVEGFRQGVVDARFGLYLGIGTFAVGTLALGGGALLGSSLAGGGGGLAVGGGLAGGEGAGLFAGVRAAGSLGVRYWGRQALLNAPQIYGTTMAYTGAILTGAGLGKQVYDISQYGFQEGEFERFVMNLQPLASGYSEYRAFGGGGRSPSPDPDPEPPPTPPAAPVATPRPGTPVSVPVVVNPTPANTNAPVTMPAAPAPRVPAVPRLPSTPANTNASSVVDLTAYRAQRVGTPGPASPGPASGGSVAHVREGNTVRVVPVPSPAPAPTPAPVAPPAPVPRAQPTPVTSAQPQTAPAVQVTPQPAPAPTLQPPPRPTVVPDPSRTTTSMSAGQATSPGSAPVTGATPAPAPAPPPAPSPAPTPAPAPAPAPSPAPGQGSNSTNACQGPTGLTPADPIPIRWYKPLHDTNLYPSPIILDGRRYAIDDVTSLPRGEPIGVAPIFRPRPGKLVQLFPEPRGAGFDPDTNRFDSQTQRFRDTLRSYGFNWGHRRYLQADHVMDLQWAPANYHGIRDQFRNMWPLDAPANTSAGSMQNNRQVVSFCETRQGPARTMTLEDLKAEARTRPQAGFFGRYFTITSVGL